MDEVYMLECTKSLLHTTIGIGERIHKNGEHLQNYMETVNQAFYEKEQCNSLEDFMKRIYNRGHYVYALRYPEPESGNFILYEDDMEQIEYRVSELNKGIVLLQHKLTGMEVFLENRM